MALDKQNKERLKWAREYSKKGSPEVMDMYLKVLEDIVSVKTIEKIRKEGYENTLKRVLSEANQFAENGSDYSGLLLTSIIYAEKCGQNEIAETAKERYDNFIKGRTYAGEGKPYVAEIYLSRLKPSTLVQKIQKIAWEKAAERILDESQKYVGMKDNFIAKSCLRQAVRFAQMGEIDISKKFKELANLLGMKPKHPTSVEGYSGSLKDLARDIRRMRYDAVEELLGYLSIEFQEEGARDKTKKKPLLAEKLEGLAKMLQGARRNAEDIWSLCKPYMKNELEDYE